MANAPGHGQHGWTPEEDARLLRLRAEGWTWPKIGLAFGVDKASARQRHERLLKAKAEGREIAPARLRRAPPTPRAVAIAEAVKEKAPPMGSNPARWCLEPGNPLSWGAITDGTLLAGTKYPGWKSKEEKEAEGLSPRRGERWDGAKARKETKA